MDRNIERVQVHMRVKPTDNFATEHLELDIHSGQVSVHLPKQATRGHIDNQQLVFNFNIDKLLHNASQEEVYNASAHKLVLRALDGYSGTLLAFGQTGAGKTYTITGPPNSYRHRGVLPRILHHLYKEIETRFEQNVTVKVSCIEIYNEVMYDLLSDMDESHVANNGRGLVITEDDAGKIKVKGLTVKTVICEEDALNYLFEGDTNRSIGEHFLNKHSSRSHYIFTIYIESRSTTHSDSNYYECKLNIVDLAGSERLKKTGSEGRVQQEALYINTSLSFLEQVVLALADSKRDHVPFRCSKLTHLLKDSIGGSCETVLIANMWAEPNYIEETLSTLRFTQRIMCVKSTPKQNRLSDPYIVIQKYEKEVKHLKQELKLQDALSGRKDVTYEPLTDTQIKEIQEQVNRYVEGNITEMSVTNLRQIKEIFLQFRLLLQTQQHTHRVSPSAPVGEMTEIPQSLSQQQQQQQHIRSNRATSRLKETTRHQTQGGGNASEQIISEMELKSKEQSDGFGGGTVIQVGDLDNLGFSLGAAPSHLQASQLNNPSISAAKKSVKKGRVPTRGEDTKQTTDVNILQSSGSYQQPAKNHPANTTGELRHGIDDMTLGSNVNLNKDNEILRDDLLPDKNEMFEKFKKERGMKINSILVENKNILNEQRKELMQKSTELNEIKSEIDSLRAKLDENKQRRLEEGLSEKEAILDQEEFSNINSLRDYKSRYKNILSEIHALRPKLEYCQDAVTKTREDLLMHFDIWFKHTFVTPSANDSVGEENQLKGLKLISKEFELDKFERLKEEIYKEDTESAAFHTAKYKQELRSRNNSLKKSVTIVPNLRNKPATTLTAAT